MAYSVFGRGYTNQWNLRPGAMTQIVCFRGHSGLAAVEKAWRLILEGMPERFLHHEVEWYASCLDTAIEPSELFLLLVLRDSHPVAICPLLRVREWVLGIPMTILTQPDHYVSEDFVYARSAGNETIFADVLRFLRAPGGIRHDMLRLDRVRADSAVMFSLSSAPVTDAVIRPDGFSAAIARNIVYTDGISRVPRKFRANLRAASRRLSSLGGVTFQHVRTCPEIEHAFATFLQIEASGWKRGNGAIATDVDYTRFYKTLSERFGVAGKCEISMLMNNDRCLAAQLIFITGNTLTVLKTAYDQNFRRFSPGHVLLSQTIERSSAPMQGGWIDLVSDPAWCRAWLPHRTPQFVVSAFRDALRPRLVKNLMSLQQVLSNTSILSRKGF